MIAPLHSPEAPAAPAALTAAACAHCGLPVPAALLNPARDEQFCCRGCETAWSIITRCRLDRYYDLLDQSAERRPAAVRGAAFTEFDDPVFAALYVKPRAGGLLETELFLENLHCAACVWLVEKLPALCRGVIEARLDLPRSILRVAWDPAATSLSAAARTLDALGYTPRPARAAAERELRRRDDRRFLVRVAVAGACAGNVMLLALALYAGAFSGIEAEFARFFRWISAALAAVSLAWPGAVFFRSALAAVRTRTIHLDVPIALALLVGGAFGLVNVIRDTGEIYFDSLTTLVFLLLLGRWIQRRSQRAAADSLELLHALTPSAARLVDGDTTRDVPVEALAPGDVVEVRAGETIPADGAVLLGASTVDQSLLSGEPWPVAVQSGDELPAGAVNLSSLLRLRVHAAGEHTRVARLMRLVEDAAARRAPIVRFADSVAGRFVVAVAILALITILIWLRIDPARAADNAVALLVVTCPCALGLATPLVIAAAIGRAARRAILIKGGDALEKLARPGLVLLDKTGCVTQGRVALIDLRGDRALLPLAAALEARSAHPVARAIVAAAGDPPTRPDVDSFHEFTGRGVEGVVDGARIAVGSRAFLAALDIHIPDWADDAVEHFAADALSPVLIAADGQVRTVLALGDPIREDAASSIAALKARGWRVGILSGDHPRAVAAVARRVGVDESLTEGGASPERKLDAVRERLATGPVLMVGDGVNDAAALAAATVGVAVHAGAEASLAAADVYLARDGLAQLLALTDGASRTLRTIHRCFAASLSYNILAASLAVTGLIDPILAAVLMPMSSFTVLAIALRSRTFTEAHTP